MVAGRCGVRPMAVSGVSRRFDQMSAIDCPRCGAIASVRQDRSLSGDTVVIRYACDRYRHAWRTSNDLRTGKADRRVGSPDRRGRSRTDRRKSSSTNDSGSSK